MKNNWIDAKKNIPIKIGATPKLNCFQKINLSIKNITATSKLKKDSMNPPTDIMRNGIFELLVIPSIAMSYKV